MPMNITKNSLAPNANLLIPNTMKEVAFKSKLLLENIFTMLFEYPARDHCLYVLSFSKQTLLDHSRPECSALKLWDTVIL